MAIFDNILLRLGAQSVTLLSTLRDPTQLRQRQCASRKQHPFFCSHVMFESKELKFLLLVRRQGIDQTQKSTASRQKKYSQGLEDFVRVFGKLTTPSVMFESKKLKFLLLIRSKEQSEPKKVQLAGKKSTARVQRILHLFLGS